MSPIGPRSPTDHLTPLDHWISMCRRIPTGFQTTIVRRIPIDPQTIPGLPIALGRRLTIGSRFRWSCPGRVPDPEAPPGKGLVRWLQFELRHASSLDPCCVKPCFLKEVAQRDAATHPPRAQANLARSSFSSPRSREKTEAKRGGSTTRPTLVAKGRRPRCELETSSWTHSDTRRRRIAAD
jgi:hypothetical protein